MTSLHPARDGRNAVRQLRNLARADALSPSEMARLINKIEACFDECIVEIEPAPPPQVRPFLTPIDGGRA